MEHLSVIVLIRVIFGDRFCRTHALSIILVILANTILSLENWSFDILKVYSIGIPVCESFLLYCACAPVRWVPFAGTRIQECRGWAESPTMW